MSEKFPLTNRLIEGFLYTLLNSPKSFDEITAAVLERFGIEMCQPAVLSRETGPKYIARIKKVLNSCVKNNIYQFEESTQKYQIV
jgi:hypothetical protein